MADTHKVLSMVEAYETWLRGGGDTGKRGEFLRLNMRYLDLRGLRWPTPTFGNAT
ncbi:MAG: hypothetical protein VW268_06610 [Rhodospirillaceae bacterium]